jgi:hypothetical protein
VKSPFEGVLALRRRSSWEAIDAGLLLWRENFVYFLPFFALPFWICAFALRLLPGKMQYLAWPVLWLLKPLFERPVLHIISVRFFESGAGMKRLCRGLAMTIFRGLPGDILWRRFSPLRSAIMPVRALESPRRGRAAQRKKSLRMGGAHYGLFLSLWGVLLEVMLLAGELLFFVIMMEFIQEDFVPSFYEFFIQGEIYIFAAWCFNYMMVETLYVCMGFCLYLNSRVEVEGWDIEILFRGFAEKRAAKRKFSPALIVLCFLLGAALPQSGFAIVSGGDDDVARNEMIFSDAPPLETLETILESPDFGGEKDSWGIRLKKRGESEQRSGPNIVPWMEALRRIFAFVLRLFLIALIAGLGVFLFYYLHKYYGGKSRLKDRADTYALHEALKESPESLLARARRCFAAGDLRLAWGFCAASALGFWSLYRGPAFPPNATEYDCLDLARASSVSANAADVESLSALVRHWVNLAYGGRLPPEGSFEEAGAFCESLGMRNG